MAKFLVSCERIPQIIFPVRIVAMVKYFITEGNWFSAGRKKWNVSIYRSSRGLTAECVWRKLQRKQKTEENAPSCCSHRKYVEINELSAFSFIYIYEIFTFNFYEKKRVFHFYFCFILTLYLYSQRMSKKKYIYKQNDAAAREKKKKKGIQRQNET